MFQDSQATPDVRPVVNRMAWFQRKITKLPTDYTIVGVQQQWRSQNFEVGGTTFSSPPPEVGVRGVTPGKILGFYIAVVSFSLLKREMWFLVKGFIATILFNKSTSSEYKKKGNVSQNTV